MRISDWSSDVCSSDLIEALEAERRIKGWSRAKKMALIRGDWDKISALAKKKDSPSTSAGRTVWGVWGIASRPEIVEGLSLVCHPDTPSRAVDRGVVDGGRDGLDRNCVVEGRRVSVRVVLGGLRLIKKHN